MIHPNTSRSFTHELFAITREKLAYLQASDPDYVHQRSLKAGLGAAPAGAVGGAGLGVGLAPGGWKGKALGALAGAALGGAGVGGLGYLGKRHQAEVEKKMQSGLTIKGRPATLEMIKEVAKDKQLKATGVGALLGGALGTGVGLAGTRGKLPAALIGLGGAGLGALAGYAQGPSMEEDLAASGKTRAAERAKNYLAVLRRHYGQQMMSQGAAPTSEA